MTLTTLFSVFIYGLLIIGIADVILYFVVKIKEKRKKRNEVPGASDHVVSAAPGNVGDDIKKCP